MLRVINRAYRLVRCMIPVAGMCNFVSYVRYVTEVEIRIVGQHTNKFHSIWDKRGAAIY
jgi:hypothetical protein